MSFSLSLCNCVSVYVALSSCCLSPSNFDPRNERLRSMEESDRSKASLSLWLRCSLPTVCPHISCHVGLFFPIIRQDAAQSRTEDIPCLNVLFRYVTFDLAKMATLNSEHFFLVIFILLCKSQVSFKCSNSIPKSSVFFFRMFYGIFSLTS